MISDDAIPGDGAPETKPRKRGRPSLDPGERLLPVRLCLAPETLARLEALDPSRAPGALARAIIEDALRTRADRKSSSQVVVAYMEEKKARKKTSGGRHGRL